MRVRTIPVSTVSACWLDFMSICGSSAYCSTLQDTGWLCGLLHTDLPNPYVIDLCQIRHLNSDHCPTLTSNQSQWRNKAQLLMVMLIAQLKPCVSINSYQCYFRCPFLYIIAALFIVHNYSTNVVAFMSIRWFFHNRHWNLFFTGLVMRNSRDNNN